MSALHVSEAKAVPSVPSAQHVYSIGDYSHAIVCYHDARNWAVETGAWVMDGLHGIIHRPAHPDSPSSDRNVPYELIDDPQWNITVDFYCDAPALEWLKEQLVPESASLLLPDSERS